LYVYPIKFISFLCLVPYLPYYYEASYIVGSGIHGSSSSYLSKLEVSISLDIIGIYGGLICLNLFQLIPLNQGWFNISSTPSFPILSSLSEISRVIRSYASLDTLGSSGN
jgi:hypothetical protein